MTIEINSSITDKQAKNFLMLVSFALACVILALVVCFVSSSDYITTDATIVDKSSVLTSLSGNARSSIVKSVIYNYTVDGVEYNVKQQVLSSMGKDVGSIHSVRYNPQNVSQLSNTYLVSVLFLAAVILSAFCFFSLALVKYQKNHQDSSTLLEQNQ